MTSLSDLITPLTSSSVITTQLNILALAGFPTTAWQSGAVPLTLVQADAQTLADWSTTIANVTGGGLLDYATGAWLDLLATSHYQVTRKAAVNAVGSMTLTDGGGGPSTIVANQLTAATTDGKYTYTNTTGGTLAKNGTLVLTWQANSPGAAYNIPVGTTLTLLTPLPGVTVTNPDLGTGTWTTTLGTDAESDASLATRCRQKWSLLSGSATAGTYQYWAVTSTATVTRCTVVENSPANGSVQLYIAGANGGSPTADVTSVNNYIQPLRPLCVTVTVTAATNNTIAMTAAVQCKAAQLSTAQATFAANLTAYAAALPIGSTVYFSRLIDLLQAIPGVVTVSLTAPAANVTQTSNQVAVFTTSGVSWTGV